MAVFRTAFVYAKTASTRRQRCKLYVKSNFINVANHHNVTLGRNMFWHCTNYLHELGTVAHRKTKPPSAVHALSRAVRFYKGFPGVILLKSVVFRGFAVIDFFVKAMFFCTNYNIGSGVTDNIKCDNSHTGEVVHGKNERVANHTKI